MRKINLTPLLPEMCWVERAWGNGLRVGGSSSSTGSSISRKNKGKNKCFKLVIHRKEIFWGKNPHLDYSSIYRKRLEPEIHKWALSKHTVLQKL